jgi:hypothetical protein
MNTDVQTILDRMRAEREAAKAAWTGPTARQAMALASFRRYLEDSIRHTQTNKPEWGVEITEWTVEPTGYGAVTVRAQIEYTGLGDGNLLRALSREWWLVHVGKRGGRTVLMCPDSVAAVHYGKGRTIGLGTVKQKPRKAAKGE